MNNETRVRIHLSKQLLESLSQQILTETKKGKSDMSGGVYTETVKMKKAKAEKASAPKQTEKKPMEEAKMKRMEEVKKKVMEIAKKHLAEMTKKKIEETIGDRDFTYTSKEGATKYVTGDSIEDAQEKVKKFGGDPNSVKEKTAKLSAAKI